jgi:hypothetical protein
MKDPTRRAPAGCPGLGGVGVIAELSIIILMALSWPLRLLVPWLNLLSMLVHQQLTR